MAKKSAAPEEAPAELPVLEAPDEIGVVAEPAPPPAVETRAPSEWADEFYPTSERGRTHFERWKHGAAEALHGWRSHAHHAGTPMQLTRADYRSAIAAIEQLVGSTYAPHPAALSPHHTAARS